MMGKERVRIKRKLHQRLQGMPPAHHMGHVGHVGGHYRCFHKMINMQHPDAV